MVMPLRVDRRFFFVAGEDAAASLDAESDDDVLTLEPALDLKSLVEDELLLACRWCRGTRSAPNPAVRAGTRGAGVGHPSPPWRRQARPGSS